MVWQQRKKLIGLALKAKVRLHIVDIRCRYFREGIKGPFKIRVDDARGMFSTSHWMTFFFLDYEQCHKHVILNKCVSMRHNLRQLSFKATKNKNHKSKETQTKSIYKSICWQFQLYLEQEFLMGCSWYTQLQKIE